MRNRIIYGLILGLLFLFFTLQSLPFVLFALLVVHVLAQVEFSSLIPQLTRTALVVHVIISSFVMATLSLALTASVSPQLGLLLAALIVIVYSIMACIAYQREVDHRQYILLLRSILFVSLPLAFVLPLIEQPFAVPLYLLLICASWAADTGAIFAGKAVGKTPLAPRISPKKTVEGVIGGALAAGAGFALAPLFFAPAALVLGAPGRPALGLAAYLLLAGTGMFLSLLGLFGDLTFSLFKREAGIKDYSLLIPGHGGILDRFDSMLFVAPVMYCLTLIWPW